MDARDVMVSGLEARARGAYERGRLSAALCRSVWLTPVAAAALICCRHPAAPLAAAGGLVLAVTLLLWRGEQWRAGIVPGLMAGAPPLLIPFLAHAGVTSCSASGCTMDPAPCILAGVAGGLVLGLLAPGHGRARPADAPARRSPFGIPLISAIVVAGLAGAVGCGLYGLLGIAGMVVGLAAGAAPVLAARVARAA
jgi:hypothetical protein